ncbi:hypothetical protein LPB67_00580 [Undibacterium sp. Jales W-56]|uniref:hypothetical protein n=1 Tax=Undibacterium sp. Jales W-56 TaxID=2897325 RepID=UPI0021D2A59F|nr:hypothetical protein [Undibacterium sp. Jales W-56]MCU6432268.1 hypothetical protein [Undibacterium sp. Jales W-56]
MLKSFFKIYLTPLFIAGSLLGASAQAAAQQVQETSWWQQTKSDALAKGNKFIDDGQLSLMLSGYAHHGRGTYTAERIAELNEKAWGLGFSKNLRDSKDNEEMLYGMVISDSHFKPQWMAGYVYQWMRPLSSNVEAGLGYTALLISRTDYFSNVPFPAVLPVASIGTKSSKLMATYVPRFSRNKGNGDVLLVFVRFDLN